jgi:hypothetical protein
MCAVGQRGGEMTQLEPQVGLIHEEISMKWAFKMGKSRQIKQKSHRGMCFWVVTIHRRLLMKR